MRGMRHRQTTRKRSATATPRSASATAPPLDSTLPIFEGSFLIKKRARPSQSRFAIEIPCS